MNEPQYIKPEYAELFKELKPDDLQLPEWLLRKLQSHYGYRYSDGWGQLVREAIVTALQAGVVRCDDDFKLELLLRRERQVNARQDLVRVLAKIAEKKSIPFEEQVSVQFIRPLRKSS